MAKAYYDESYEKLFRYVYGIRTGYGTPTYIENNRFVYTKEIVHQIFTSYQVGGGYDSTIGIKNWILSGGGYWLKNNHNTDRALYLSFNETLFITTRNSIKGHGFPFRCVAKSHFSLDFYAYL